MVTSVEKTCQKLQEEEAEELWGEVKAILRMIQPPRSNISIEEHKAVTELRRDNTGIILKEDKGVSLVVMNKEEYVKKTEELFNQTTYRTIPNDPTNKYKNKLRRPIVSSIGAVSYETSKELARILKPLVGKSPYQVQNTQDFIQQIQGIKLKPDWCIMSYNVKALFTSVPIQPALDIIRKLLEEEWELQQRTSISVSHITCLLEFCLRSTYFTFQGRYYKQ